MSETAVAAVVAAVDTAVVASTVERGTIVVSMQLHIAVSHYYLHCVHYYLVVVADHSVSKSDAKFDSISVPPMLI